MAPLAICIGLSRTGTKSFGEATEILGFSRLGWIDRSDDLLRAWHHGRRDELFAVADAFDILGDLPWPLIYKELAREFTETKFVLTRRSSVDVWLTSIIAHTNRSEDYWGHEAAYGSARPARDPDVYRRFYADHLAGVREFFSSTGRLLEVCWETGSGWQDICAFLDVPVPDGVPFPHSGALATKLPTTPSQRA
jgi:hypothetical protein